MRAHTYNTDTAPNMRTGLFSIRLRPQNEVVSFSMKKMALLKSRLQCICYTKTTRRLLKQSIGETFAFAHRRTMQYNNNATFRFCSGCICRFWRYTDSDAAIFGWLQPIYALHGESINQMPLCISEMPINFEHQAWQMQTSSSYRPSPFLAVRLASLATRFSLMFLPSLFWCERTDGREGTIVLGK